MTQYGIKVHYGKEAGQASSSFVTIGSTLVHFCDHPTRYRAVMYGIVKELISLLEHHKASPLAWPRSTVETVAFGRSRPGPTGAALPGQSQLVLVNSPIAT